MNSVGSGDMAQFFRLRNDGSRMQNDLLRLTTELSTGQTADIGRSLAGDFSGLSDITRSLRLNTAFRHSITEAATQAATRQSALSAIQSQVSALVPDLMAATASGSLADLSLDAANTTDRFIQSVATMNLRIAGQSVFAGNAPDQPALIDGRAILDGLTALVAGAATSPDMIALVSDWFMTPGSGYDTQAWQGGAGPASPITLAEGVRTDPSVNALAPEIRQALAGLALSALVGERAGPGSTTDRGHMIQTAANWLRTGESGLTQLQARLGGAEARIEEARVQAETTRASLEIERGRITAADPYRTATELEALQNQLDALYLMTARLSRLTLMEYLR